MANCIVADSMIRFKIEQLPPNLRREAEAFLVRHGGTPSAMLRPIIAITQSTCVAFSDDGAHEGITGAGPTPRAAVEDFNRSCTHSHNGADGHGTAPHSRERDRVRS